MREILIDLLSDSDHLSSSIYDVATVAFYDGPNRQACLQWLIDSRNADGSWGEILSWQNRYLCTYSASIAMLLNQQTAIGQAGLLTLYDIPDRYPDNWTQNFGGLIAVLDGFATQKLGLAIRHHPKVQEAINYDVKKWRKITKHEEFYNPQLSIAGYFAEWAFLMPSIDLDRLLENFQAANGSISHSPSASTFFLMICQNSDTTRSRISSLRLDALKAYVDNLNPLESEVGILDQAPNFVAAWLLMYLDHTTGDHVPDTPAVRALRAALTRRGKLVSATGDTTFPGDMDTTTCAVVGLNLPTHERAQIMEGFDHLFSEDHYITLQYERTASLTTNVHAVAAWPENPRTPIILDWIKQEITKVGDLPRCKWHTSPFYTLGEIARLFADIQHPQAQWLARHAGDVLLKYQLPNGSWGWQGSTVQETSGAVIALDKLRRTNLIQPDVAEHAIRRASAYLNTGATDYRCVWIAKALYYLKPLERWLRYLAQSIVQEDIPVETRPISVLYVDDNPSWRRIFETMMTYHDWQLSIAEDAESALSHLQHEVPDIVVMDLVLPGMTGYQAFEKIREMNLPCSVVATTAYYSVNTAEEIHKMGFDGYLEKPFSIPTVTDYLQKFVKTRTTDIHQR